MSGSLVPFNISLPAASGSWSRDGPAETGWNASYTGNTTWPNFPAGLDRGAGSLFFRTQAEHSSVKLDFTGTSIALCVSDNGSTYALTVDDKIVRATGARDDPACANYPSSTTLLATGLDFAAHSATLNVLTPSNEHEFQFFGGQVTTDIVHASNTDTTQEVIIDDQAAEWVMVPGRGKQQWDNGVSDLAYDSSYSFTCQYRANSTATYTFQGASAVVLYGALDRDSHDYAVSLDGRISNLDASAAGWNIGNMPIFFESNLDPAKVHTITISNFNDQNPTCAGPKQYNFRSCCAKLDSLKLIGSSSQLSPPAVTPSSTSTSASVTVLPGPPGPTNPASGQQASQDQASQPTNTSGSNVGAIAGGAVGGIIGGLIIFALVFYLMRRNRQRQTRDMTDSMRHVDLSGPKQLTAAATTRGGVVRPFLPPPAASSYSTSSAGYAYTPPTGDRKAGHGTQPVYHSPPASHVSSGGGGSQAAAPIGAALQQEDMDRVLQFVAQQMDQRAGRSNAGETLPSYDRR
ncbi:hypothetical protein BKA62DRAFT_820104 [Auriculariales sp. MPI-PUGE-AT-0066]|nr:hypothetical protein BKA62DRAFT_820104 [Auriculariales sp. MPI-PUGE-AT-0066]